MLNRGNLSIDLLNLSHNFWCHLLFGRNRPVGSELTVRRVSVLDDRLLSLLLVIAKAFLLNRLLLLHRHMLLLSQAKLLLYRLSLMDNLFLFDVHLNILLSLSLLYLSLLVLYLHLLLELMLQLHQLLVFSLLLKSPGLDVRVHIWIVLVGKILQQSRAATVYNGATNAFQGIAVYSDVLDCLVGTDISW